MKVQGDPGKKLVALGLTVAAQLVVAISVTVLSWWGSGRGCFYQKFQIFLILPTIKWEGLKFFSFHFTLVIDFRFKYSNYNQDLEMKNFSVLFFFFKGRFILYAAQSIKNHYHLSKCKILTRDMLINVFFLLYTRSFTYPITSEVSEVFRFQLFPYYILFVDNKCYVEWKFFFFSPNELSRCPLSQLREMCQLRLKLMEDFRIQSTSKSNCFLSTALRQVEVLVLMSSLAQFEQLRSYS